MDYDRNIHHNPDADAWAKFFVETTKDMDREVFNDVAYMRAWFANAMMAMHDSMKPHKSADEIERLREQERKMTNHALERMEEIERLREALRRIGEGDTCVSLMSHPPICKRAYDARSALQQKESE